MKIKSLVITAVLATAILSFGNATPVRAAGCMLHYADLSVSDQIACLTEMISDLTAQIAALQAQQGTTQWCHTFNTNLGVGAAGSELNALDQALIKDGDVETGSASTYTEDIAAAVVKFQAKYGIRQTGYVGPLTRAKLNSLYGCNKPSCASENSFCGGIAGIKCCSGFTCKLDDNYPDSGGKCIKSSCTPNWTCGWGPCVNGWQSKTAIDSNNCGIYSSSAEANCSDLSHQACSPSNSITINSVSGPNSLNVGQTGTWTVNATAPSGTNLTYGVDWGDSALYPYPTNTGLKTEVSQTSTFTHSYSQAGTYTVKFTVSGLTPNCPPCPAGAYCATCVATNNSAQTSITVVVGNISDALSITSPADLTGFVGQYYDKTFSVGQSVTATSRTYTWSVINGSLPPGLSITYLPVPTCGVCAGPVCPTCFNPYSNVNPSIKIAGTPTVYGDYSFTLLVTDDLGNRGSVNLKISISSYSSTPSITIISPNGGEVYNKSLSTNTQIQWTYSPLPPKDFSIQLFSSSGTIQNIRGCGEGTTYYQGQNMNNFSYNWDFSNIANGQYKIQVTNCNPQVYGGPAVDFSDNYFTISSISNQPLTCSDLQTAPASASYFSMCNNQGFDKVCFNKYNYVYQGCGRSYYDDCTVNNTNASQNIWCNTVAIAQPSITIISPNGGETFTIGQAMNITWQPSNFSASDWFRIYLTRPGTSNQSIQIAAFQAEKNASYYSWIIPSTTVSGNNYEISVDICHAPFGGACIGGTTDYSNAPFSIVAP